MYMFRGRKDEVRDSSPKGFGPKDLRTRLPLFKETIASPSQPRKMTAYHSRTSKRRVRKIRPIISSPVREGVEEGQPPSILVFRLDARTPSSVGLVATLPRLRTHSAFIVPRNSWCASLSHTTAISAIDRTEQNNNSEITKHI